MEMKTYRRKDNVRSHAEIHVSGLSYPCSHGSERFPTRGRLNQHQHDKHSDIMEQERTAAKTRNADLDPKIGKVRFRGQELSGLFIVGESWKSSLMCCLLSRALVVITSHSVTRDSSGLVALILKYKIHPSQPLPPFCPPDLPIGSRCQQSPIFSVD